MDIAVEPHLEQAALITIDTQVDTLDGQPLEIPGTSSILPNLRELCKGFREANRPIVHVVRLYLADGSNAEPVRKSLVAGSVPVLRPGSPGRLLAPGLGPDEHFELDDDLLLAGGIQHLGPLEAMIYKPRWGAFYNTPLQTHLDTHGVNTLVFGGCNFPNCPRTSIYEASERDYGTVLAEDATSGLYDRGRTELINIGVSLLSTHWLIAALTAISPLPSPAPGPAAS